LLSIGPRKRVDNELALPQDERREVRVITEKVRQPLLFQLSYFVPGLSIQILVSKILLALLALFLVFFTR